VRKTFGLGEYDRQVELCQIADAINAQQQWLDFANETDVEKFEIGKVYALRSREASSHVSTGVDIEVPRQSSLVRIIKKGVGRVFLEKPAGFSTTVPPYLCLPKPDGGDSFGKVHWAQGVRIENLTIISLSACGSVNAGMYNCHFNNIAGDVGNVVIVNGFAHCSFRGFRGTCKDRVVETKFCAHDSIIGDIASTSGWPVRGIGMFSIGEGCRNIDVSDVSIVATAWSGGHLFQLQASENCSFRKISIIARSANNTAIQFYSDDLMPMSRIDLDEIFVEHGGMASIVFADGLFGATRCTVRNSIFVGPSCQPSAIAVAFNGGTFNRVENCQFSAGEILFSGAAEANEVVNTSTRLASVSGDAMRRNSVRNLKKGGGSASDLGFDDDCSVQYGSN
jgi:hypothetical protein